MVTMARVFDLSRRGFYDWLRRPKTYSSLRRQQRAAPLECMASITRAVSFSTENASDTIFYRSHYDIFTILEPIGTEGNVCRGLF